MSEDGFCLEIEKKNDSCNYSYCTVMHFKLISTNDDYKIAQCESILLYEIDFVIT